MNENNTLSKADIAASIQVAHGLTKIDAVNIVNTIGESLLKALEDGKTVDWYQLMKLKPEWKPAHKAHNPKTREEIDVPAKWTVYVSLSKVVKEAVKQLPPPTT